MYLCAHSCISQTVSRSSISFTHGWRASASSTRRGISVKPILPSRKAEDATSLATLNVTSALSPAASAS